MRVTFLGVCSGALSLCWSRVREGHSGCFSQSERRVEVPFRVLRPARWKKPNSFRGVFESKRSCEVKCVRWQEEW